MPPFSIPVRNAVDIAVQNLRIALCHPYRRRSCGRTEDHLHFRRFRQLQEGIEQRKVVFSFPRLHQAPGKFSNANHPYTQGPHSLQILFPKAPIPLLRVIAHPQRQALVVHNRSHSKISRFLPCKVNRGYRRTKLSWFCDTLKHIIRFSFYGCTFPRRRSLLTSGGSPIPQ